MEDSIKHVYTFNGKPTTAPVDIPDHGIDVVNKVPYYSVGVDSPSDWVQMKMNRSIKPFMKITPDDVIGVQFDIKDFADRFVAIMSDATVTTSFVTMELPDIFFANAEEQARYMGMEFSLTNITNTTIYIQNAGTDKFIYSNRMKPIDGVAYSGIVKLIYGTTMHFKLFEYVSPSDYKWVIAGDWLEVEIIPDNLMTGTNPEEYLVGENGEWLIDNLN